MFTENEEYLGFAVKFTLIWLEILIRRWNSIYIASYRFIIYFYSKLLHIA